MARTARPRTLTIAVDVEGAGRGPRYLYEFYERFVSTDDTGARRRIMRFVPVALGAHTKADFISKAIPLAVARARAALKAVPRASMGIGIVPAMYNWGNDFWSFTVAYAVDQDGPLFGTTSKSPEDIPDEMLAAFNADANRIAENVFPKQMKDTQERLEWLQLAVLLCPLAIEDLVMRVPHGGDLLG